jgi:hypothetical protein
MEINPYPKLYKETEGGIWRPWPLDVKFRLSQLLKRKRSYEENVEMNKLRVFAIEFNTGQIWDCVVGDLAKPSRRDRYRG